MRAAEQVHLTLDLDPTPGTMRGSLTDAHGGRRLFEGWIQLANALRAAHESNQPTPQEPQTGEHA